MNDPLVVKRYAEAFWSFGAPTDESRKRCLQDLKILRRLILDNPEFLQILESPEITHTEKVDFMDKILGADFCSDIKDFLKLLLEKERIDHLNDIIEYIRTVYGYEGEVEALLKTAYPLDLELIRSIKERLEKKFNKRLKLYIELDGRILGGVQVEIGNTVIDGSVRNRLDGLREKLRTVRVD